MRTLIFWSLLVLPATAQDERRKVEIDNDLVRVERRLVSAHETLSAAEMPPALLVFLTDYSVRLTTAKRHEEQRGQRGEFRWHLGGRISLENLSEHRVEVAQIMPKFAPASEGASTTSGRKVEFENDLVRVQRGHRAPGRRVFVHHGPPSVLIQLSAVRVKLTHPDGHVEEFLMKPGDIRFEPGDTFTIETETLGESLEALRIELRARNGDRE